MLKNHARAPASSSQGPAATWAAGTRKVSDKRRGVRRDRRAGPAPTVQPGETVQRKCATCEEQEGALQRKALPQTQLSAGEGAAPGVIVDDDVALAGPGQISRAAFMATVRTQVTTACNEELAQVGRTAADCPYLRYWLDYYDRRSAHQIERAVAIYTGGGSRGAQALLDAVVDRVRTAVRIWAATGKVTGLPSAVATEGEPQQPSVAAAPPAAAVERKANDPSGPSVASGAEPSSPDAVRARLGDGRPLDAHLRGRMEHGFGRGFDSVRVHTDANAAGLATDLGARAFTVGGDIAFAAGEFQPGTPRGDLLLAHELAHTVQQGAARELVAAPGRDRSDDAVIARQLAHPTVAPVTESVAHERAADQAAAGVLARLYATGRSLAGTLAAGVSSMLPSRLALRRCSSSSDPGPRIKAGLDRGDLELAGMAAKLEGPAATAAAKANDKQWAGKDRGQYRIDLLTWLRGGALATASDSFTIGDVAEIARLQQGAGLAPTGKTDDATMAVLLHAGFKFSDDTKQNPSDVVIEMYPGELEDLEAWKRLHDASGGDWALASRIGIPAGQGKLYVRVRGKIVARYNVRGGPPVRFADRRFEKPHVTGLTEPGNYHLGGKHAYTTSAWLYSQIEWGAVLKRDDAGEIMFKEGSGKWQYATGPKSKLETKLKRDDRAFWKDGKLKSSWDMNDFGPASWQLLPDGKGPSDQFVHTTPYEEQQVLVDKNLQLECSHGCVHTDPTHRDEMVKRGYLQKGVKFVVHPYAEHLVPDKVRKAMMP